MNNRFGKTFLLVGLMLISVHKASAQTWERLAERFQTPDSVMHKGQGFGRSVAVEGDYAVVGSPTWGKNLQGTASVFHFESGAWVQVARLVSNLYTGSGMGATVAISGDVIAVGAAERVFVFNKPVSGWTGEINPTAVLLPSDHENYDHFGSAIDIGPNEIVAGSYGDDDLGSSSGAAYVFEKPVLGWISTVTSGELDPINETAKLTASDGAANDQFGYSVSLDGTNIAIGSPSAGAHGAVYMFSKPFSGWTSMTEQSKLKGLAPESNAYLGLSVDLKGDILAAGVPGTSSGNGGEIYVYKKPAGCCWVNATESAILSSSVKYDERAVGLSVSVQENQISTVALWNPSPFGGNIEVRVLIFEKTTANWSSMTENVVLTPSDLSEFDYSRIAIATDGGHLLVGVPGADYPNANDGAVYAFEKPVDGWKAAPEDQIVKDHLPERKYHVRKFGSGVCLRGDLALVGSTADFSWIQTNGPVRAELLQYDGSDWNTIATLTPSDSTLAGSQFGVYMDMRDNLIVIGGTSSVYLYEKPVGGWEDMTETSQLKGSDALGIGDVAIDSDGETVAAVTATPDIKVFTRPTDGWAANSVVTQTASLKAFNGTTQEQFYRVAMDSGQVVGGSSNSFVNGTGSGAVYVFEKPGSGWMDMTETAILRRNSTSGAMFQSGFGYQVEIAKNTIVASAPFDAESGTRTGTVFVYERPVSGWINNMTEKAQLKPSDIANYDSFGRTLAFDGEQIVVGKDTWNKENPPIYYYQKGGSVWSTQTETQKIESQGFDMVFIQGTGHVDDYTSYLAIDGPYLASAAISRIDSTLTYPEESGAIYLLSNCPPVKSQIAPISCGTYTSPGGVEYTSSSQFTEVLQSVGGCDSIVEVNLTVYELPQLNLTSDLAICSGEHTQLSVSGADTYTWDQGAGNGSVVDVQPGSTTTYTVTGVSAEGCSSQASVTVTVHDLPVISLSGNNPTNCGGSNGSILVTGSGSGQISWTGTSTSSVNGQNLPYQISNLKAGAYAVTFTDAQGCVSAVKSQSLADPGAPAKPTISVNGATTLCAGESVLLSSSAATGNLWSNGSQEQSITVTSAGTYSVSVSENGCTSTSDAVQVTVSSRPVITSSAITHPSACGVADAEVTILGGASGTLSWSGPVSGAQSNATLPFTISGLSAGTYEIILNDGCASAPITVSFDDPGGPAKPVISADGPLTFCEGGQLILSTSGTVIWSNGTNSTVLVVTESGNYYAVAQSGGCTSTSDVIKVTVNPNPQVSLAPVNPSCYYNDPVDLVGTPSGGSFSGTGVSGSSFDPSLAGVGSFVINYSVTENGCTSDAQQTVTVDSCLMLPELAEMSIEMFPNPVSEELILRSEYLASVSTIHLYDLQGRLVAKYDLNGTKEFHLHVQSLARGSYRLSLRSTNASLRVLHFMKE